MVIINDGLRETSPCKGLASSGYFPAKRTCSASLSSRAFCMQPGFCSCCVALSLGSPSTCLSVFSLCHIFASFETSCCLVTWIEIW